MSETIDVITHSAIWSRLGLEHHNWPGRFSLLLAAIALLLVTQPIFAGHAFAQNIAICSLSLVLLAAVYAVRAMRIYFILALILLIPAIGFRTAMLFTLNPTFEMIEAIASCLFLGVTVLALVSRLFIARRVTLDTISAAICAYLLMGIAFAYAFAAVELRNPASFSSRLFQSPSGGIAPLMASLHSFIYYSFVCLTTTGFGDISPISEGARSLSVMESVFGQLYVAILIARLVSLEVAQSMTKERE